MPQPAHFDDAYNHLLIVLISVPQPNTSRRITHSERPHGYELFLPDTVRSFYQAQGTQVDASGMQDADAEPFFRPFYDAAWEMCRRGLLRMGRVSGRGTAMGSVAEGEGYSLTEYGRSWINSNRANLAALPPTPGRFAEVLAPFAVRFGPGFKQRATEAASCYRTANYLACCVMAGAAAEAILLTVAIARSGDEPAVLRTYESASGRRKTLDLVTNGRAASLTDQFRQSMNILSYWRDTAGHGQAIARGEIEAHEAISRLLRLCQITEQNWTTLSSP